MPPSAKFVIVATGNYIYSSCHDERTTNNKKKFLKNRIINNPLMELRRKNTKTKGRQGLREARKGEGPAQPTRGQATRAPKSPPGLPTRAGQFLSILYFYLLYFYYFTYISLTSPFQAPPMTRLHD